MNRFLLKSALLFSVAVLTGVSAGIDEDYQNALKDRVAKMEGTLSSQSTSGLTKQKINLSKQVADPASLASTVGSAVISYSPYNFQWMVFSGGWYWNSTDQYSAFYDIFQNYNSPTTYGAILTLDIYRTSITAYNAAVSGINVATTDNATIYENKTLTTFNGYTAYYNSYTYSTTSSWSVDEWYFTVSGTTYRYQIFTTVADWNTNKTYYNLLKIGVILPTNTLTKSIPKTSIIPYVSYSSAPNGKVCFSGLPANSTVFIYDIAGTLIRNLTGNTWDGLSNNGSKVTNGFYVTNIKMPESSVSLKILKK